MKNALARPAQLLFYDAGVGITDEGTRKGWPGRTFDAVTGGAFGSGLSGNVQQAYRWVCDTYEDGDCLYFFGFSRGAFTARSTVGMIRKIGLLRSPVDTKTLKEAFDRYRDDHHPNCVETDKFRRELNTRTVDGDRVCLHFVGVWDTVGALGLPVVGPRSLIARRRWGFHDLQLSSHVKTARQALAIDERRVAFLPAPWVADPDRAPGTVEQRWFAGCHSDVGGKRGDLPFYWLAKEAEIAGLVFDPGLVAPEDPVQESSDSLSLVYRLGMGSADRPIREKAAIEGGRRFENETIGDPPPALRRKGVLIGDEKRWNVQHIGEVIGPRIGWGLFGAYYLSQYEDIAHQAASCGCERIAKRAADDGAPATTGIVTG